MKKDPYTPTFAALRRDVFKEDHLLAGLCMLLFFGSMAALVYLLGATK